MQAAIWQQIARDAEQNFRLATERFPGTYVSTAVDAFVRSAANPGPGDNYKHFSLEARNTIARATAGLDQRASRAFLRAVLERTIVTRIQAEYFQQLPPQCARFHAVQLQRIARDTDTTCAWLDVDADLFQKEFGIASGRLHVAGSNLVDIRCGVPRSVLWRGGMTKLPGHLRFLHQLGGFRPYFQGHLHTFNLHAVNPPGREDFYRCCAELHERHPECLGLFCSSWYYDPALEQISPWLAYLRRVPLAGGARLFFVEQGGSAIANATATSRTRKRLHEEGRYMPCTYMFVWGRKDLMTWARRHPPTD